MVLQFNKLDEIVLIKYNRSKNARIHIIIENKPEFIFILAKQNPPGTILISILWVIISKFQ